jgi:hypothetical protein
MATLEQMAGTQELVFTCRGQEKKTGPITMLHIAEGQRLLEEWCGKPLSQVPLASLSVQSLMVTLTQLLEDAGHIPEEITDWRQKVRWVGQQFTLSEMRKAEQVIGDSLPPEMREQAEKALGQALQSAGDGGLAGPISAPVSETESLAGQVQFIPPGTLED